MSAVNYCTDELNKMENKSELIWNDKEYKEGFVIPLAGEILTAATVEEEIAVNRRKNVQKEIIIDYVKKKLEETQ